MSSANNFTSHDGIPASDSNRRGADTASSLRSTIERLEAIRDLKRQQLDKLFEQQNKIQKKMKDIEGELMELDDEIDAIEYRAVENASSVDNGFVDNQQQQQQQQQKQKQQQPDIKVEKDRAVGMSNSVINSDENLTRPSPPARSLTDVVIDKYTPDPSGRDMINHHPEELDHKSTTSRRISNVARIPPTQLNVTSKSTIKNATQQQYQQKTIRPTSSSVATSNRENNGPLDDYFVTPKRARSTVNNVVSQVVSIDDFASSPAALASVHPPRRGNECNVPAKRRENDGKVYPWSEQVKDLLHNTFRIQAFRGDQEEIINCTMEGRDAFVIMRTGGGKSLTYQLPALLEGRSACKKVTLVISPLLSLIKDQEDQMNAFAQNSALSFTSGLKGGNSEHARRWQRVRDPDQGVCLIFVTPEKVHKSGKLRSELQKLYEQGRLGRFVIDECHCACQWGHDFRPDYAKLGMLKNHFPNVPLLAVTATASEKVRNDCCHILKMHINHKFFRSTANRPNLNYAVRAKEDAKGVIEDMVAFIKEYHAHEAGIIYTYSRKDADTVADKLVNYGILAESYHSDVRPDQKDLIHHSWMNNDLQVVVATIAFGLGINKPDVRFVLHHTLSKTLEAYYQESGRAGRDGKPADCILYYSPKDVPRMIRMTHGESSEQLFWNMVKYAQEFGNDEVCRAFILNCLGEPNSLNPTEAALRNDGHTTDTRDVGFHARTVLQLLQIKTLLERQKLTLAMLVKEWRMKPGTASECVRANPPGKDLNVSECERIIVALIVEEFIGINVVWNAYDCVVYLTMTSRAQDLIASSNPSMILRLPKRKAKSAATPASSARKNAKARKSTTQADGWIDTSKKPTTKRKRSPSIASAKKPAAKRRKTKATRSKKVSLKRSAKPKNSKTKNGTSKRKQHTKPEVDVIELSDDSSIEPAIAPQIEDVASSESDVEVVSRLSSALRRQSHQNSVDSDPLWNDDSENEFQ